MLELSQLYCTQRGNIECDILKMSVVTHFYEFSNKILWLIILVENSAKRYIYHIEEKLLCTSLTFILCILDIITPNNKIFPYNI